MYPTGNHLPSDRAAIGRDIEYLTKSIEDAKHKPYLRPQLVNSLLTLGYDKDFVEAEIERYFKVALQ